MDKYEKRIEEIQERRENREGRHHHHHHHQNKQEDSELQNDDWNAVPGTANNAPVQRDVDVHDVHHETGRVHHETGRVRDINDIPDIPNEELISCDLSEVTDVPIEDLLSVDRSEIPDDVSLTISPSD